MAKRVQVFAPEDWFVAFEKVAASRRQSLSEFLRDAGVKQLPAAVRRSLSQVRPVGRPAKGKDTP